jgi:hypothetical protein
MMDPGEHAFDPDGLRKALDRARLHETPPAQVAYDYSNKDPWEGDPEEYAGALGPFPDRRGGGNGVVVRCARPRRWVRIGSRPLWER